MQFWPRKRAKHSLARIRAWAPNSKPKVLGFIGYKAGMTHIHIVDQRPKSLTKGEKIFMPVTIVECPPMTVYGVSFYKKGLLGSKKITSIFAKKLSKELAKKLQLPKNTKKSIDEVSEFEDLRLLIHSNPAQTGIGVKKPKLLEFALGGSKEEKLNYVKEILGKEISINDVFTNGKVVDIHAITKGKGFQGPVKRFGVALRNHRSEKTKRGPGSLGGWKGHAHFMYRVAHAGQTGYHQRTEYNKQIIKIGTKDDKINPIAGFKHYGLIKNEYILLKGSIAGPNKRLIRFNNATRPSRRVKEIEFNIQIIH